MTDTLSSHNTETTFSITGTPVSGTTDTTLASLRARARTQLENAYHHGWVHSIDGNTIMVLFPIDDHHPNEHSPPGDSP